MSLSGDIISDMNMEAEISAIGEISGEVDLSGAGTTPHIVASATVSPDPGIPSCNVVRSGTDETPNFTFNFEGIKGEPGEQGEQGEAGVDGTDGITPSVSATASVSPVTGTPSVTVTRSGTDAAPNFDFAFAGLKGERGAKGDTGEAGPIGPTGADGVTPDISATASVSNTTGTPSVVVTKTGADMNPNFDFAFENIKGEQGIQGDPGRNGADGVDGVTPIISATGSADNATGIPNVVITRSGTDTAPNFDFAFHNIKGEKGDTGEGVPDDTGARIGSVVTHTSTGNDWVLPSADNTSYDNTQSGLTATDVQDAIDEEAAAISQLNSSKLNKSGGTITGSLSIVQNLDVKGYAVSDLNGFKKIPVVTASGVLEIGKYIDMHSTAEDTSDYTFRLNNDTQGHLFASGTITQGSSRKIKENIEEFTAEEALKILQLNPIKFDYIKGSKNERGFIAEEVAEILPNLVTDEEGTEGTKEYIPASLNYIGLIPYLIKVVQLQQKQIDKLLDVTNS